MAKDKEKCYPEEDDGRVIADMNVDGMPWFIERKQKQDGVEPEAIEKLSRQETRSYIWGMLKAVFLVLAVFGIGYLLFIIFCLKVWFV